MSRQLLPQRQLFTVRLVVAALSILACLIFIFSYSSRIMLASKVENELEAWQHQVEKEATRQAQIKTWLSDVENPATVEAFAREEMNWVQPGDQPVVLVDVSDPAAVATPEPQSVETPAPANWQLWWNLVAKPDEASP